MWVGFCHGSHSFLQIALLNLLTWECTPRVEETRVILTCYDTVHAERLRRFCWN